MKTIETRNMFQSMEGCISVSYEQKFVLLWKDAITDIFSRRYSLLSRLIFTQNGNIQDRIYRNNSDLLVAYYYIRGFRDFQTKTSRSGCMDFRDRLVQDSSIIVQPRGNELCSFQLRKKECMPLFMPLRWRHFHVPQEWLEMLKKLWDSSIVRLVNDRCINSLFMHNP